MRGDAEVIAIVDDDERVRRALRRLMRSLEFDSTAFASGEELLADIGRSLPCCVLLDLHMPRMTGLDVLRAMRSAGSAVPVIIITGFDEPGMRERCLNAGAAAYLLKPIEADLIATTVSQAVRGS